MTSARSAFTIILVALTSTSGCRLGQLLTRNLAAFGEERSLPNKITHPARPDARLAVLWVGHATALIQMDDRFILTDPVFTETVGQISPRLVEPGIEVKNLPPVDAVLISHMHFDHLSLGSLELLAPKVRWLGLPRGGLVYLTDFAFPAGEVPWWSTQTLDGGLRVTSVPVQHNGWRYGIDRDWRQGGYTGWVIEYRGMTVYFSGDTSLNADQFRATAQRFPNIDLALLPISPIHPRDLMHKMHIDPNEALTAFELLGASWMVPVHYNTFVNSLDEPGEPKRVLLEAMKERGLDKTRVAVLEIGEQRVFIKK
ncbi:MAG: MBL fold metallo-hydrolase [Coriobacteriia bacterium]